MVKMTIVKSVALSMVIFGAMLIVIFCGSLTKASAVEQPVLLYKSTGFHFSVVPFGGSPGFEQPAFDDSQFSLGDAPFGSGGYCPLDSTVKTSWPRNTDILLRKTFDLPRNASAVEVAVAIDNDIQVFINGVDISGGLQQTEFCTGLDRLVFPAQDSLLVLGGSNLLAVRARDRGEVSFVDTEVRADMPEKILRITSGSPVIPTNSGLIGGSALTRSDLALRLTGLNPSGTEEPVSGCSLTLQSNRGSIDTIYQPGSTDGDGESTARVETRAQLSSGSVSTITSNTLGIRTEQPAVITWLPAKYESTFYTTCYSTELESDYPSSPYKTARTWTWCKGVHPPSNKYRQQFMDRVSFQGSGVAEGGEVVQYTGGCYYISSCPLTASGQCAQVGTTIAVDRTVIPFRGTVDIDSIGIRKALDTGGAITGYDIDVYNGVGKAACNVGWSRSYRTVNFLNY